MSQTQSKRTRLRRWYYDKLDFGDPMRYVHLFYTECARPECWCHRIPREKRYGAWGGADERDDSVDRWIRRLEGAGLLSKRMADSWTEERVD